VSILINLLPDTRQAKLRERRRRQMVGGVSVLVWAICGGIVALMSIYEVGQKAVIAGYSKDINDKTAKLRAVPDLLDALTAQQHTASLSSLYDKRVYMTKFFQAYTEANPSEVTLNTLAVDNQNIITVNGIGKSYAAIAKLARALAADNVEVGSNAAPSNSPYFTGVAISGLSASAQGVAFTIHANLDSGVTSGNSK
jgi:Tfp pilus assembly protein PilN